MNFSALLNQFKGNAETAMLTTALHYATVGKIDVKHMDAEAMAIGVFGLVNQLEAAHPGTAEKYGWAKLSDLKAFADALGNATQATRPDGLQ